MPNFVSLIAVKDLRAYQIPFVGLRLGIHHFNYEINEEFFRNFKDSLITTGKIFTDVSFDKKERLFILNFDISGSIETECDRCGENFNLPVHGNFTVYIKIGEIPQNAEKDEDVIWLPEGESVVDISELIYEFIHLSMPMHKIHPDKPDGSNGCNTEILKRLNNNTANEILPDPRWDILKSLKKN